MGVCDEIDKFLTRFQVIIPSELTPVSNVDLQVHIVKLESRNGECKPLFVHWSRSSTNSIFWFVIIAEGVGLHHEGELDISRGRELLSKRPDELVLVPLNPALGAVKLAGRLAAAAVPVGKIVMY